MRNLARRTIKILYAVNTLLAIILWVGLITDDPWTGPVDLVLFAGDLLLHGSDAERLLMTWLLSPIWTLPFILSWEGWRG